MAMNSASKYISRAGRASRQELKIQRDRILLESILPTMLEAIPDPILVLSRELQVIAVNNRLLRAFGLDDPEALLGKRPGEVFGCIHAEKGPDGCTSGRHCTTCGAALAIIESRVGNVQASSECRIILKEEISGCLDLQVVATPVVLADIPVTFCVMKDISAEKRAGVLEKVFFHDVINTATGIRSLAELLADGIGMTHEQESEYKKWLVDLADKLVEEIRSQGSLLAAEKGQFKVEQSIVSLQKLMREILSLYLKHTVANGKNLVLGEVPDLHIISDPVLLRRVVGNLVKNALEAVRPGETVTIYCSADTDHISFCVHNPGVMPEEVQLQLFQRSFSTKAANGRGVGTYSAKMFGERYLGGKVDFVSREPEGTTFFLTIPIDMS